MFNTKNKSNFFFKKNLVFFKKNIFNYKKFSISVIGKVFRWFFNTKKIQYKLNHAHINIFYFNNLNILKLKLGKYNNKLIVLENINEQRFGFFFKKPRLLNIFTKRGVYIQELPYFKKQGKISDYTTMFNIQLLFTLIITIWYYLLFDKNDVQHNIFLITAISYSYIFLSLQLFLIFQMKMYIILFITFLLFAAIETILYLLSII